MPTFLKIGHRGASGLLPENTVSAFQKAIDLGADMVELDVHVCRSGELIVIHDETVDRTTNGTGRVKEMTLTEIKSLTIKGGGSIPTLQEVIDATKGKCRLNIEVKKRAAAAKVIELIRQNGIAHETMVSSNYVSALRLLKKRNSDAVGGLIYYSMKTDFRQAVFNALSRLFFPITRRIILWRLRRSEASWANIDKAFVTERFVAYLHERGFQVAPWVVNRSRHIQKMRDCNVDAIMSDYPDRLSEPSK